MDNCSRKIPYEGNDEVSGAEAGDRGKAFRFAGATVHSASRGVSPSLTTSSSEILQQNFAA